MRTGRSRRTPAGYLLVLLAALLTMLSGPSAAVHAEGAGLRSAPHIEGLSPHGDEATTRAASTEDDLDSSAVAEPAWTPGPGPGLRWPSAAADATGPIFAVVASPWSGRSPPRASLPL